MHGNLEKSSKGRPRYFRIELEGGRAIRIYGSAAVIRIEV